MANYATLKAAVQAVVKTNGNKEITGANLQTVLLSVINSLGAGYQFMGVATPSTDAGSPDNNVAYIGAAGTYANFGSSITIPVGSIGVFKYNGSWTREAIELYDESLIDKVNDIETDGCYYDVKAIIPVTEGTVVNSRVNIYNGTSIPAGTTVKFKFYGTNVASNKFYIVNNSWVRIYDNLYTDGDEIVIKLTASSISFGICVEAEDAQATGNITAMLSTQFDGSIGYEIYNAEVGLNIEELARKCDVGAMSFSQGAFYTTNNSSRGKEAPDATHIRCDGAFSTPFTIDVPKGYFISKIFYYSEWVSNANCNCVLYQNVNSIHFVVPNKYPLVRFTIKKESGGNITPSEFYTSLMTIMPVVDNKLADLNAEFNQLAQYGFLYNITKVFNITQGETILSRDNLATGSFSAGDTIKFKLNGTNGVLSEVWITNYSWHTIYKGSYTDGDIITATLSEDTTSMGLYVDVGKAVGTGEVTVEMSTDYDNSIAGKIDSRAKMNNITVKRYGTSGVDADFCGLNAIGDAVASITDASEDNQYNIFIDGHFLFTNPKMETDGGDFKYEEGGEPTILIGKKWVHFIGIDKENAVIEINLDGSLTTSDFPSGKTFTDYQPIYIREGCEVRNLSIIGTNVRYVTHIETNNSDLGVDIQINNCDIISKASTQGHKSCLTVGEIKYFTLELNNVNFINENGGLNSLFGGHTPLSYVTNGRENCIVRFNECKFLTGGTISLGTHSYNRTDEHIFNNCEFHQLVKMYANCNENSVRPIGTLVRRNLNTPALPFYMMQYNVVGLRISTTTGNPSSVRIDPTCSAFAIIGNVNEPTSQLLPYSAIKTYGYEYKDDPSGSHAYACGWVNIDPTTGNSLGSILGDCSSTSKTLKITINGSVYNVVFNTNLTSATNASIISAINSVIGSVATCDTFNPELNLYPQFLGEEYYIENEDSAVIEMGMGVVKTGANSMRRAKQNDGYIDGIAVDTIYPQQQGRIVTKGRFLNQYNYNQYYFHNIKPTLNLSVYGTKISIDPSNDGKFIVSNTSPVLKYIGDSIVEIL